MLGSGILGAVLLATEFTEKIIKKTLCSPCLSLPRRVLPGWPVFAGVAELADAHDSKSCSVRSEGSSPSFGTGIITATSSQIRRTLRFAVEMNERTLI